MCERIVIIHVMLIMVFTCTLSNLSSVDEHISFICKIETEKTRASNSQSELFSLATDWSSGLSVDAVKKGMFSEKKQRLVTHQMMGEYLAVQPTAESLPFTWIKSHLAEKYQIECRSMSNFFVGILDAYELVGGNRNRAVKCKFQREVNRQSKRT